MELPNLPKIAVFLLASTLLLGPMVAGCQKPADSPAEVPAVTAPVANEEAEASSPPSPAIQPSSEGNEATAPEPKAAETAKPDAQDMPSSPPANAKLSEPAPADAQTDAAEEMPTDSEAGPRDLGPPLVDNRAALAQLHPTYPVWFDKEHKSVVMLGEVCQRRMSLELFACLKGSKEHESIVSVPAQAYVVHAGLLAAGAEPGNPVQFYPEYVPARGPEIEVTVIWKDEKGQIQRARAQDWVRNAETKKPMEYAWVFAGSHFVRDEQTKEQYYRADGEGDLICVSNFPSAVLDIPVKSTDQNAGLLFECFTERIPPIGTPVTLILTPKSEKSEKSEKPSSPTAK